MAENNQQQQQQQTVKPEDARAFLGNIVSDPEVIKGWDDTKVVQFHGHASKFVDTAVQEAVKKATGSIPVIGEKWREHLAGDDKDDLKTLERFKDPKDLWGRTKELNTKLSKGELKFVSAFPEKGTDAEKAAWRKEQGIPETHDKYDLNLGDGVVIGEQDKKLIDGFLQKMHGANAQPGPVKEALKWALVDLKVQAEQERAEGMANLKKDTEDKLRAEWKGDYRMKRTAIENMLSGKVKADSDLHKLVMASVETNPEFAKLLAGLALDLNPAASLVPGEGGAAGQLVSIEAEIAKIEDRMRKDRGGYNKDEKMQARYRELVSARDTMQGRARASATG